MSDGADETASGFLGAVRRHPLLTTIMVVSTLGGTVLGYLLFDQDASAGRRLLQGAIAGFGVAFFIITTRLVGAFGDYDDD